MTITCPEPAAAPLTPEWEPSLGDEMAAAAQCAAMLSEAGLHVAFSHDAEGALAIAIEHDAGEPLRRLSSRELLSLIELTPVELAAWAARPELPIPCRRPR